MIDFVEFMLFSVFALWSYALLARLQAAWETRQRQLGELRQGLTASGLALMKDTEKIEKLQAETTRLKTTAAEAAREQKERHENVLRTTRPPPPEVHVTSEYPPARGDSAWIADFARDSDEPAQPWERPLGILLLWAPTQAAALAAARHLIRAHRTYRVGGVRPLA